MPDREHVLNKVRSALGRHAGQAPSPPPAPRLVIPEMSAAERLRALGENFQGRLVHAASKDEARDWVASAQQGRSAIASSDPLLEELGIYSLPGVHSAITDSAEIRRLCSQVDLGITSASYALADPGALVMLSSAREDRLMSLLPPSHIVLLPAERILTGLDELFTILPDPAAETSSMVLIGGPSRTGDIEMTLTVGVHGPKQVTVVVF
jgi:L-lactate dehydrogenase complex protein LldG